MISSRWIYFSLLKFVGLIYVVIFFVPALNGHHISWSLAFSSARSKQADHGSGAPGLWRHVHVLNISNKHFKRPSTVKWIFCKYCKCTTHFPSRGLVPAAMSFWKRTAHFYYNLGENSTTVNVFYTRCRFKDCYPSESIEDASGYLLLWHETT